MSEAHNYLPEGITVPNLGDQDGKGKDTILYIKLFTPDANWTWYMAEHDPTNDICFGYVEGIESEWGYFSLDEIKEVRGALGLPVERDIYFDPQTYGKLKGE